MLAEVSSVKGDNKQSSNEKYWQNVLLLVSLQYQVSQFTSFAHVGLYV